MGPKDSSHHVVSQGQIPPVEAGAWIGEAVLGVAASQFLTGFIAAYYGCWMSATNVIFPLIVWVLGFALGGAIGGFLTGMRLAMPPSRACARAVIPAAMLGAAA